MPVVIGPGGGGVLFHEACGHGLEADLVAKGASVFAGRVGERVADPRITLVDDGTMAEEWGAFAVDDEGSLAQRNVLIEDGILTDYMYDLLRSRKEGRARSGNGRRQSYKHLPMVRMTNTYVLAGPDEPDDIIAGTPDGVYVAHLGGGQVNTATGDFVFGMTEAYLIEDGQITEPIREGNLIGNGPAVLASIDAVGHDFAMGSPGMCGKDGQGVPGRRRRARPCGCPPSPSAAPPEWHADNPELLDVAARIAEMAGAGRAGRGLRRPQHQHLGEGLRRRGREPHPGQLGRRRACA